MTAGSGRDRRVLTSGVSVRPAGALTVDGLVDDERVHPDLQEGSGAATLAPVVTAGDDALTLSSLLPLDLTVTGPVDQLTGCSSSWGLEFEPTSHDPERAVVLGVDSGRSSQGAHPRLVVEQPGRALVVGVHWSGNWQIRTEPGPDGLRVLAGLAPTEVRRVAPGESYRLPAVTVAWGPTVADASLAFVHRVAERAPAAPPVGPPLLTEWNHWWPYEDAEIDEDTFLAEAAVAAEVGLEIAVLDAGWFGVPEAASSWVEQRGDWDAVNTARFPHGLAWLAERTRGLGLEFGIWIEAEAIGPRARVAAERPELVATRSGEPLGYVCLGSPAGRTHVRDAVAGLVRGTGARWIKWDFNLDPGAGCDRDDHGHRSAEGLVRHYEGLYAVLDELRAAHPQVVLEACSSGGLRIDPGLAEHVDAFFLSDPDWTEHALCCLWGAAQQLPPRQILHWVQSEFRGEHRFQKVDYSGTLLTLEQFDAKVRAALLHRFGLSVRLTQMRPELRHRLTEHVRSYREVLRPLVADGLLRPLGPQPLREERGHRRPAFQLSAGDEHAVAAFRLAPVGGWEPVRPVGLDPDRRYRVRELPDGQATVHDGATLLREGVPLPADDRWSTLLHLAPEDQAVG